LTGKSFAKFALSNASSVAETKERRNSCRRRKANGDTGNLLLRSHAWPPRFRQAYAASRTPHLELAFGV